ncbi:MAG: hypothetical protein E7B52_00180 [Limosilactobacillus fermentum]|nr:hypothetical protein [Limosilactobacillus fermentum]
MVTNFRNQASNPTEPAPPATGTGHGTPPAFTGLAVSLVLAGEAATELVAAELRGAVVTSAAYAWLVDVGDAPCWSYWSSW